MRTSLNEIAMIEAFLLQQLNKEELKVFQQRLNVDYEFRRKVKRQKTLTDMVLLNGRMELKKELDMVHADLFANALQYSFVQKIIQLFK